MVSTTCESIKSGQAIAGSRQVSLLKSENEAILFNFDISFHKKS
jgi:hypothetical protein